MIWFYYKSGQHLHYEIRNETPDGTCELIVTDADGSERIERFDDRTALDKRVAQLQAELARDGWTILDQRR